MSIKRKGACALLAALMIGSVVSAGALTVYAEPDDEPYTEEPEVSYTEPDYTEPDPDTGSGDNTDPDTGTGDYTDPDTGTGDYTDPDTGTGDYTDPGTGTGDGDYTDPDTGTGDGTDTGTETPSSDPYYNPDYENDYPDYYTPDTTYENAWGSDYTLDQDYQLDQNTATSQISTDVSVDTSEMTADDWQQLQKNLAAADPSSKANLDALDFAEVKKNKDDGTLHNDNWIFLAIGIPLLILGLGLVGTVIIVNIKASQTAKAQETINLHTAPKKKMPSVKPAQSTQTKSAAVRSTPVKKSKSDLENTLTKPLDIPEMDKDKK